MAEKTAIVKRDNDKVGQIPELVFRVLVLLNFLIILFVTLCTAHALWGYVHEGSALEFLIRAGREEQAMMTTLAGIIVVLMMMISRISTLFDTVKDTFGL